MFVTGCDQSGAYCRQNTSKRGAHAMCAGRTRPVRLDPQPGTYFIIYYLFFFIIIMPIDAVTLSSSSKLSIIYISHISHDVYFPPSNGNDDNSKKKKKLNVYIPIYILWGMLCYVILSQTFLEESIVVNPGRALLPLGPATEGFSGSDIVQLCREAARGPFLYSFDR